MTQNQNRKYRYTMITVPTSDKLQREARNVADLQGRTLAGYLRCLIRDDLRRNGIKIKDSDLMPPRGRREVAA